MLVLASTALTVLIIIAAVIVVVLLFLVIGPLTRTQSLRDDEAADARLRQGSGFSDYTREEIRREEGLTPELDEERLDRENE